MKSWFYSIGIDYDFQKRRKEEKKQIWDLSWIKIFVKLLKRSFFILVRLKDRVWEKI